MKEIKEKEIKVGDFIYVIETLFMKKNHNRRFIINFLTGNNGIGNTKWWGLKNISEKTSIFDPIKNKGSFFMLKKDWEYYKAYKLNKKEIEKFNKLIILSKL